MSEHNLGNRSLRLKRARPMLRCTTGRPSVRDAVCVAIERGVRLVYATPGSIVSTPTSASLQYRREARHETRGFMEKREPDRILPELPA